jgi:hypothetical protein
LTFVLLISLIMGYFLCRSAISVDLLLKPPPMVASGETETLALDLSCSKRARKEDAGGDLGRAEEERHTPQLEATGGGGRTEELVCPEAPANVFTSPAAMAEAGLTRAGEVILTEIVMPHPVASEAVAGEVATADASSDLVSQEDAHKVAVKVTEEAPMRAGAPEPSEPAARASSNPEPAPSMRAFMPAFGMGIGAAAGPLLFGAAFNSDRAPQGPLTAQAVGSDRGGASPTPKAVAKDASGEKVPTATAGNGVGSQSSASELQKEWADIASSAETSGNLKAQGNSLTLAELSKQLSAIRESLRNVNFQFLEATQTINVSNVFSIFNFFYRLGGGACSSTTNFSLYPSPRVSR